MLKQLILGACLLYTLPATCGESSLEVLVKVNNKTLDQVKKQKSKQVNMEAIFALYIILGLLVLTGYIVYKLVPIFLRGAFFLLLTFSDLNCLGIILYVICWITLPWIMAFLSIAFGLLDQDKPKSPTSKNSKNPSSQPTPCE